jgi:hypothetical protein
VSLSATRRDKATSLNPKRNSANKMHDPETRTPPATPDRSAAATDDPYSPDQPRSQYPLHHVQDPVQASARTVGTPSGAKTLSR